MILGQNSYFRIVVPGKIVIYMYIMSKKRIYETIEQIEKK